MGLMLKDPGKVTCSLTHSVRKQPSGLFVEHAVAGTDAARGETLGISHRSWLKSADVSRDCPGANKTSPIQQAETVVMTLRLFTSCFLHTCSR